MSRSIYILLCILLVACGKGDSPKPDPNPNPGTNPSPAASILNFPVNNEACTSGIVVSATESTIPFTWKAADNTESYEITIKNLETSVSTTQTTTTLKLDIPLKRNTAYSWFITSKSSKTNTTARSEVWKFYNSGPGTSSYAPFPAEIILPAMGADISGHSGKVTLDWTGADADNDIAGYDIYLGTASAPSIYKSNEKESILTDVPVNSNSTYYWKVISRDSKGNTSDSGVFKFNTK